jgi:hypothetical protein
MSGTGARCRVPGEDGAGARARRTEMGRGDRAKVRWARDRKRKKKEAEKRRAAEKHAARKASKG